MNEAELTELCRKLRDGNHKSGVLRLEAAHEIERLQRRLFDIADAFGADPNDQRDLCVKARGAGAKLEILTRERDQLLVLVGKLQATLSHGCTP